MWATGFKFAVFLSIFLYDAKVSGHAPEKHYVSIEEFSSFKAAIDQSISQFSRLVQNQQEHIDKLEKNQKEIIQRFEEKFMTLKHEYANEITRLENDIVKLKSNAPQCKSACTQTNNTEKIWTPHHQPPRSDHSGENSAKLQHNGDVHSEQKNVHKSSLRPNPSIHDAKIKYQDEMFTKHIRNIGDNNTKVAFFASSNDLSDLGKNQIITFPNVHTNVGNLYNAHTGVFYCDVSGTYVFSYTITCEVGRGVRTYLSKNGNAMLSLESPSLSNDYGSASGMAILELEKGDSVMVKSYTVHNGAVIDNYSYFSGFLLYPTRLA